MNKRLHTFLRRSTWWDRAFGATLLFHAFVRFSQIAYPFGSGDVSRDYLVARHIALFGEHTFLGPANGVLGMLFPNSPLYYYLLAPFVSFKDDIMFLVGVNVVLQLISIVLVYLIARHLFGPGVALAASLLFGLNEGVLQQAVHPLMPYVMQPFLLLGFLFLAHAFTSGRFLFFCIAAALFPVAAALHNSVVSLFPMLAIMFLLALRAWRAPLSRYASLAGTAAGTALLLLAGPLFYFFTVRPQGTSLATLISPASFAGNMGRSLSTFLDSFFGMSGGGAWLTAALGASFIAGAALYLAFHKEKARRTFLAAIVALAAQPFLFTMFLRISVQDFYFTPSIGLIMIAVAEVFTWLGDRALKLARAPRLAALATAAPLLFVLPAQTAPFPALLHRAPYFAATAGDLEITVTSIREEIAHLKTAEGGPAFDSFGFVLLENGRFVYNAPLVAPLEKTSGERLVALDPYMMDSYARASREKVPAYLIASCIRFVPAQPHTCAQDLARTASLRNYALVKEISDRFPFAVYLLERSAAPGVVQ